VSDVELSTSLRLNPFNNRHESDRFKSSLEVWVYLQHFYPTADILLTGHSLGGTLAMFVALASFHQNEASNHVRGGHIFNSGSGIKTINPSIFGGTLLAANAACRSTPASFAIAGVLEAALHELVPLFDGETQLMKRLSKRITAHRIKGDPFSIGFDWGETKVWDTGVGLLSFDSHSIEHFCGIVEPINTGV